MADLGTTFNSLVNEFSEVINNGGKYDNWGKKYLYPTADGSDVNNIVIEKVDDPGQSVRGNRATIINYLNGSQTPPAGQGPDNYYPRFVNSGNPKPKITSRQDHAHEGVGEVSGTDGTYYNNTSNYNANPKIGIPVQYILRFKQSGDVWYLCTALVWPLQINSR
jgi:hypothetical protein